MSCRILPLKNYQTAAETLHHALYGESKICVFSVLEFIGMSYAEFKEQPEKAEEKLIDKINFLYGLNHDAFNELYNEPDNTILKIKELTPFSKKWTEIELVKFLDSVAYQCSSYSRWDDFYIKEKLDKLRAAIAAAIIDELPEYKAADTW